ncbi:hypothetical protein JHK87_052770 [Glycine soja]|nr:hypothetical protein JHK87_052770 [Glycine soja]
MNPKDVGLLCPVINQEANPASCNEPKERWSLVFSVQPRRPSLENTHQEQHDQMLRVLNHLTWKTFTKLMQPSIVRGPCYVVVLKVLLLDTSPVDGITD